MPKKKQISNKQKYIQKLKRKEKRRSRWQAIKHYFTLMPLSDITINVCVLILILFGTFMIVSTNVGQTSLDTPLVVLTTLGKQMAFLVVSFGLMWFANHAFRFNLISRWWMQVLIIGGFVAAMILPFFFSQSGGSHAWIRLPGGFTIQPSEFTKPMLVILVASSVYLAIRKKKVPSNGFQLFKVPFLFYILMLGLLALQKDLGTAAIVSVIFYSCLLIPSFPEIRQFQKYLKRLVWIIGTTCVLFFGFTNVGLEVLKATPFAHVATRIENTKDPYQNIFAGGYQPANSLYGIASSNVTGRGVGQSARKYGYLTQAENDYILSVTIEETGIFGFGLIVICYALIGYRLFYYAFKTTNTPYKIVLTGTVVYMFMHFFLNVGGVTSLIPFTGVPLLFISAGGSSLMAISIAIGVCQHCISQIRMKEMKSKNIRGSTGKEVSK